jgi:hypothetical protein
MAKTKRAGAVTRTSATPPTSGVPTEAPLRPALTAGNEEEETARAKATDPHRTGADRTAVLRARVAAAHSRHAHKTKYGKLPTARKPAAKPVAKAKKNPAAAKPVAATETY